MRFVFYVTSKKVLKHNNYYKYAEVGWLPCSVSPIGWHGVFDTAPHVITVYVTTVTRSMANKVRINPFTRKNKKPMVLTFLGSEAFK